MAEALAYRGPDSASLWSEGSVGLCESAWNIDPFGGVIGVGN